MNRKYTIVAATVFLIFAGIAETRLKDGNSAVAQTAPSPSFNSEGLIQRVESMRQLISDSQPRIGSFTLDPAFYQQSQLPDILANGNAVLTNSSYTGDGKPLESCAVLREQRPRWAGGQIVEFRAVKLRLKFSRPFPDGWKVTGEATFKHLEISVGHETRLKVTVEGVDKEGINLEIATWEDTPVLTASISYIAIGEQPVN